MSQEEEKVPPSQLKKDASYTHVCRDVQYTQFKANESIGLWNNGFRMIECSQRSHTRAFYKEYLHDADQWDVDLVSCFDPQLRDEYEGLYFNVVGNFCKEPACLNDVGYAIYDIECCMVNKIKEADYAAYWLWLAWSQLGKGWYDRAITIYPYIWAGYQDKYRDKVGELVEWSLIVWS